MSLVVGIIETNISPFARLGCKNLGYLQFQILGMSNLFLFGLLVVLMLLAQFASAKTADEVVERYIVTCGGLEKLANVKSIYLEAVTQEGAEAPTIIIIKEQNKFCRTEMIKAAENAFLLITEKGAWAFSAQGQNFAEEISNEKIARLQLQLDIMGPLVDYLAKGHMVVMMGKEVLEENSCFKIKLTTKSGVELLFWLDAKTYMIKQSSFSEAGSQAMLTQTFYKNYTEVDGIKFAQTIITRVSSSNQVQREEELFFKKILLNPAIDSTIYQPNNQL